MPEANTLKVPRSDMYLCLEALAATQPGQLPLQKSIHSAYVYIHSRSNIKRGYSASTVLVQCFDGLPWYQESMVDVLALGVGMLFIAVSLSVVLARGLWRALTRRRRGASWAASEKKEQ